MPFYEQHNINCILLSAILEQKCGRKMKALGCFNDRMGDRLFPYLLDNHRDPVNGHVGFFIDWRNYQQSLDEYVVFLMFYEITSYFKCSSGEIKTQMIPKRES